VGRIFFISAIAWRVIKTMYQETETTYFAVALNQMATATRKKSSAVSQLSRLGSKNCSLILIQCYVMASIKLRIETWPIVRTGNGERK